MNHENNSALHVIFGSGTLGKHTARVLHQHGQRVRMVNRSGKAGGLPAGIEVCRADANDAAQTRAMTAGAHAVYQCAQPEYHEWAEKFPRLQQAILDGAAANGARLVVADNLYMYGDPKGQPIHEALPMRPNTRKGAVRAQMAQAVMDAHAAGRLRVAVVRGSDFFGPEDGATSAHNFPAALAGKPIDLMGRIDMPHTFTYTPDFGRALAWAGMNARALGEVWHVPSAPAITQRQFADALALALGRPVKTRVSGRLMLSLIGLFNPTLREMPEMLYEWDAPYILDDTKMRAASGLQHTPLAQAIQTTLDWFAHQAGDKTALAAA